MLSKMSIECDTTMDKYHGIQYQTTYYKKMELDVTHGLHVRQRLQRQRQRQRQHHHQQQQTWFEVCEYRLLVEHTLENLAHLFMRL
jgi:hypothetical protein